MTAPTLHTARLTLRPYAMADFTAFDAAGCEFIGLAPPVLETAR